MTTVEAAQGNIVTQDRLKEILEYDPNTGLFTRIKKVSIGAKIGDVAGSKYSNGYINISIDGKRYGAHRLAILYMTGEFPEFNADHINGIRDDNRWENIRSVTHRENCLNQRMPRHNSTGFVGIYKEQGKWRARVQFNKKNIHLGCFDDLNDAISARKAANLKFGFHRNHGVRA